MESTPTPRRRWRLSSPRLSLRALIFLVLVLGGGFGWVVHRAQVQRDAVAAIERAGGSVVYDWRTVSDPSGVRVNPSAQSPWPKWVVDRVGVDVFHSVRQARVPRDVDAVLASVAKLEDLESLTLGELQLPLMTDVGPMERRPILTDVGLARLRGLSRLTEFCIEGGARVSKVGLENLVALTRLRVLFLSDVRLSDDDLAPIGRITSLEEFDLNDLIRVTGDGRRRPITDAGLGHLAGLTGMKKLSLNDTQMTSAGLFHLAGMTGLQELSLADSRVADLTLLPALTGLRMLNLDRTPVDDVGLAPVAKLRGLQELSLNETRVTDAGLIHITKLPALKDLDLDQTAITDDGLTTLQGLSSLTTLSLSGTRVSGDGRQAFRKARRDVRVKTQPFWLTNPRTLVDPAQGWKP